MDVGFTGTRVGMTVAQSYMVELALRKLKDKGATTFHHGDCVGADEVAHFIALRLDYDIVVHPPVNDRERAYCLSLTPKVEVRKERAYLDRNKDIVNESDVVLATPQGTTERGRGSGTWQAIRYARKQGKVTVVYPDGSVGQ